ncbi:ligase-associated DNA damage response exonuclease [soil metagenome]
MSNDRASSHWIAADRTGIHVRPAGLWIDPSVPRPTALITHGHADHARGGHGETIATPETLAIMGLRYGTVDGRPLRYGETLERGGVRISLHPAGHVLGSAQILLEHAGERVVVTGDYKTRPDPTCAGFEPVPCDIFVTEATFGLPVFRHPPIEQEVAKLLNARAANPDRCVLVGAYALGKAQRVIAELRRASHAEPIYLHGALEKMCRLYGELGVDLGELRLVSETEKEDLSGRIVVCPPSALTDRWSRRLPDPITAMASGWMRVRQRARARQVELPLIISDHADWDELTGTIAMLRPAETWVTHGAEEALVHWCTQRQMRARALAVAGYEDEDD